MTKQEFLLKPYANEDQLTAQVYMYINNNYPAIRGTFYHIANESATSDAMRLKLSSMGVLAGVPDFCFNLPVLWYLELKMPNGCLSPAQKKLHERWAAAGIPVETAYNKQQIINAIEKYIG